MVLPIIGGAVLLGFITFGENLLGKKLFKQTLTVIILLSAALIGYFLYQLYKAKEKTEDVVEDAVEKIAEGWEWIFEGGAKEEAEKVLSDDPRYKEKPQVEKDILLTGEYVSQIFGGSAYSAGHETAQNTYNIFNKRYGIEDAERYEELPTVGQTMVSAGEYFGIVEAGRKTKDAWNKFWG